MQGLCADRETKYPAGQYIIYQILIKFSPMCVKNYYNFGQIYEYVSAVRWSLQIHILYVEIVTSFT